MIKVVIADDHEIVRQGVSRLLQEQDGITVVGEASNGEDAIKITTETEPDVVLMDVKMPGIGGMEATRRLVRQMPELKVIAISTLAKDPIPSRALKEGASGYLTKGADINEVVQAIKVVMAGQRYISPDIAQQMALKQFSDAVDNPFESLSERELQVALMIVNGQRVQDISASLHLSSKTINSYRYRIFEKLKIASDVELTHLALRYGLIEE